MVRCEERPKENGLLSEGDAGGAEEADKARTFRPNHQFQTLEAVFDVCLRLLSLSLSRARDRSASLTATRVARDVTASEIPARSAINQH